MKDLSTCFFGLTLKNPVIAGSCGLTGNIDSIVKIAKAKPGAIVLKSVFEEEIDLLFQKEQSSNYTQNLDPEYLNYFDYVIKEENLGKYLDLIQQAKKLVDVPIVASVSCITSNEWFSYVKRFQDAGADAIELNLFIIPSDVKRTNEENERFYFESVRKVNEMVSIPVTLKVSYYFSNLAKMMKDLSSTGIAGITLFNRFYSPDINIEKEELTAGDVLSNSDEYLLPLRWTGILSSKVDCPIAATTGVHSAETAIKMILAGAGAVQIASAIYKEGPDIIGKIIKGIEEWMNRKSYNSIKDFKGKLAVHTDDITAYERVQFMKYFGNK